MFRWRSIRSLGKCSQYAYSTVNPPKVNVNVLNDTVEDRKHDTDSSTTSPKTDTSAQRSKLVAAAFASLKEISNKSKRPTSALDEAIASAKDINSLLSVAEEPYIARRHALKIVSILSEWAQAGKIKLNDFELDIRFARICKVLGRIPGANVKDDMADLSIVLGVTADEQAAKLISSISLPQMIKILSSLSLKKRRSTPLLRSLSYNIGQSSENLNIKEASDVLYACACLNYPDDILLEKTSADILLCLKDNQKSSVVNSIINSVGILRYRDTNLLNHICDWLIENKRLCGTRELVSMLITLASVNYLPENFPKLYKILKPALVEVEMSDTNTWIDIAWSLVVLEQYEENIIDSVLKPDFISKLNLDTENKNIAVKLKLLNINGAAKQLKSEYKGHLLENLDVFKTTLARSKEKQLILDSVLESISSIVKVPDYIKTDTDTGMGFLIDAECLLNSKRKFVKLEDEKTQKITKVAIMISSYHEMCRGCLNQPTGLFSLIQRLIKNSGYEVLSIPYTEYNPRERLLTRVNYLNQKLKETN